MQQIRWKRELQDTVAQAVKRSRKQRRMPEHDAGGLNRPRCRVTCPKFDQPQDLRTIVRNGAGGMSAWVAIPQRAEGSMPIDLTSTTVEASVPEGTPGMPVLRHSPGASVWLNVVPEALPLKVTDTGTPLTLHSSRTRRLGDMVGDDRLAGACAGVLPAHRPL